MKRLIVIAAALCFTSASSVVAEEPAATEQHDEQRGVDQQKTDQEQGMQKGMKGQGMTPGMMMQMMQEPHHMLGMAYKRNLISFGKLLQNQVRRTGKVDKDSAREAVEEMKRSLDQMKKQHDKHVKTMPQDMRKQMADMMKAMEGRISITNQHLQSLEREVKSDTPDPKKVLAELEQILRQCKMMPMDGMGKGEKMK